MKVKICGITDVDTALKVVSAGADALGFVFAKSKRQVSPEQVKGIVERLPEHVLKIGVFVNEEADVIEHIMKYCRLDFAQLHGEESPAFVEKLSVPTIKALGVNTIEDVQKIDQYNSNYFLLDSPKGVYHGGNGISFQWELVKQAGRIKSVILAGGLHAGNVREAIEIVQPVMVDVSSGVETDGKKDIEKVTLFIKNAKQLLEEAN